MSRSIHRTRRDLSRELAWRHPDEDQREARLTGMRRELERKRALKRKSASLRSQGARRLDAPPCSPETVPIREMDGGPYVHHHASPEDVRAILRALPEGTLTGVTAIELCLGTAANQEHLREEEEEEFYEPDPYTGRSGAENIPGIFSPLLLGCYAYETGRVWIHAYVHDRLPEHPAGLELYLRLLQLSTLVHELAHHDDASLRCERTSDALTESRMLRGEAFARKKEREWIREVVVPYLERAYPAQVRAWEQWMKANVGLPFLPRTEADEASFGRLPWTGHFAAFLGEVVSGRDTLEACIELADDLHYDFLLDLSLAVVRSVLAHHPDHLEGRALEADVLEHLDRLDEAQACVDQVLRRDASSSRAWRVQVFLLQRRRAWPELVEATRRAREQCADEYGTSFASDEALAHVHLGAEESLAPCLNLLRATEAGWMLGQAAELELQMQLRLGRYEQVLSLTAATDSRLPPAWRERAALCRALALLQLGRPPERVRASAGELTRLRHLGFVDWADALENLGCRKP